MGLYRAGEAFDGRAVVLDPYGRPCASFDLVSDAAREARALNARRRERIAREAMAGLAGALWPDTQRVARDAVAIADALIEELGEEGGD